LRNTNDKGAFGVVLTARDKQQSKEENKNKALIHLSNIHKIA
jgi:hypothetical protein